MGLMVRRSERGRLEGRRRGVGEVGGVSRELFIDVDVLIWDFS